MAALGLKFLPRASGVHAWLNQRVHARWQLWCFAMLYSVTPRLVLQLRRALIMRGCSMPNAAPVQQRAWACMRACERATSCAKLINLVCFSSRDSELPGRQVQWVQLACVWSLT